MSCFRVPAGIVRPFFLLVLTVFMLCTAGCIQSITGNVSSSADQGSAGAPGNDTNTTVPSDDFSDNFRASLARPVSVLDRSIARSTIIPVIPATNPPLYTGPSLNAKGNDVAIEEVLLATETINSSEIKG